MADFIVEAPHTKEECMQSLDEMKAKGPDVLSKFEWGCQTGEHVAWGVMQAKDENEVKRMIPDRIRSKAKIHQVQRLTARDIEQFHRM